MFKLFFTLGVFLLLGMALLALRHHRLEVFNQTAKLHEQIKLREDTLRDQQVLIAARTNPLAVAEELRTSGLDLFGGGPAGVTTRPGRSAGGGHDPDRDLVPPGRGRSRTGAR